MRRVHHLIAALLLLSGGAFAQDGFNVTLTRIADDASPKPEGGHFNGFDLLPVTLWGPRVYIYEDQHIYEYYNGAFTRILTNNASYPHLGLGPVASRRVTPTPIGERRLVYYAHDVENDRPIVLLWDNGNVQWAVAPTTTVEGTTNLVPVVYDIGAYNDRVVARLIFSTADTNVQPAFPDGYYLVENGDARRFLTPGMTMPGGFHVDWIDGFSVGEFGYAFAVSQTNSQGPLANSRIYVVRNGVTQEVVRTGSKLPDRNVNIAAFMGFAFSREDFAFLATGTDNILLASAYRYHDNKLETVVGRSTPLPGTTGTAMLVSSLGFDGGNVAFTAKSTSQDDGLFAYVGNALIPIVLVGDVVDGAPVRTYQTGQFLSGNALAFTLTREGHTPAAYLATIAPQETQLTPADYDGDGSAEISAYEKSRDTWSTRSKKKGFEMHRYGFGSVIPVPGDYDGDGKADRAVYDPASGTWYITRTQAGPYQTRFGNASTVPVPGDYDGDGRTDVAVYDKKKGWWYLGCSTIGYRSIQLGRYDMAPVPADYDGDGRTDIAVFQRWKGQWYIRGSSTGMRTVQFGSFSTVPVPGNYDGKGGADLAVFNPKDGKWYIVGQSGQLQVHNFGFNGARPVIADYDDDGRTDRAVYDPASGTWYIARSKAGYLVGGL